MATTDVLLLKPIEGLGFEGDLVTVKAGFARNYLLPRGLADPSTLGNRKRIEVLKQNRLQREATELKDAETVAKRLQQVNLAFAVKTGEGKKMYGSITANNIAERIAEEGLTIDRRKIQLQGSVRTLGKHQAQIKLHHDVVIDISFEVVSENPIIEDDSSNNVGE